MEKEKEKKNEMARIKSKLYSIIKYFETADLASAQDTLAMCREIVKGRTPARPPKKKAVTKPAPAPSKEMDGTGTGGHLGAHES